MERKVEVLAEGLGHPEGPCVLDDGRVAFANTYRGEVSVWEPGSGVRTYAHIGGGPNACMLGSDDAIYVTLHDIVAGWTPVDRRTPSIRRVAPDGAVEVVCSEIEGIELNAPNDLTFGPDGTLYFTDSGYWDPDTRPDPGYVFSIAPDGDGRVIVETGNAYPNGIVAEADGSIVWVETYPRTVRRRSPDGSITELATLAEGHDPDGLKVAANGDLWITTISSGGIDVLAPDGRRRQFVEIGDRPLNCVFGAGESLYVCDAGPADSENLFTGRLVRVATGIEGMPLFRGAVQPR